MAKRKPVTATGPAPGSINPFSDAGLLRPGVTVGRHPSTGILHRLTINSKGQIVIERKPYVSALDGWTQRFETVTDDADKHLFLILIIKQNPATWPD